MILDSKLSLKDLESQLQDFWILSGQKILSIEKNFDAYSGAPVFTSNGKYTSRGWTEWTQGFQYGSAVLQFEVTKDEEFLSIGRKNTVERMAPHLTHIGVHDHGFNNLSTYGNLLRLITEGTISASDWEKEYYRLALKVSGAVQAMRWTKTKEGGFIHSFNGPHSLFVDTIRSVRIVLLSHLMGHEFKGENDETINLLERGYNHIAATAKYNVFYGEGRDKYDLRGRTAHECIFNTNDGNFRSSSTQQGYSGFSTWTRGLAWAILGFAEELELMKHIPAEAFEGFGSKKELIEIMEKGAKATCDFFIDYTATDGIPYWDTGAPGLVNIDGIYNKPSDPDNAFEPIDSSAAAIAAQGLIRLGNYLNNDKYIQAGLISARSLFSAPYLSQDEKHEGLILHSIYHRPNDWDFIPKGSPIPKGESSMWGDYHARELALLLTKMIKKEPYYQYFNCLTELS